MGQALRNPRHPRHLYSNSKFYFFSGKQYIRVTRDGTDLGSLDSGYPAPISRWNWPAGFATDGINAALYTPGTITQYLTTIVTVSGSENDNRFLVTDFSISPPTPVFITPPFMGGCLVDAEETLAAVGNYQGNTIALYDLTNPASPALISTYDLSLLPGGFGGIGALSLNGKYVLVGEAAGPTIVLLDISQPPSSAAAVASTITNNSFLNGGVLQIVLKGVLAVAAGNYDCYMFDFTNPAALRRPFSYRRQASKVPMPAPSMDPRRPSGPALDSSL